MAGDGQDHIPGWLGDVTGCEMVSTYGLCQVFVIVSYGFIWFHIVPCVYQKTNVLSQRGAQ